MFDIISIVAIAATFFIAGSVKGIIGLGLPTVSLGLLTAALDLTTAMALLLVPSFATNLWQAWAGRNFSVIVKRLWPFLLAATVTIWFGANALNILNLSILSALLGALLVSYAVLSLSGFRLVITPRQEFWAGPFMGAANGILTGMTGSFVVPGVMFLQSIGFGRDMLIQAMGILFTVSTLALAFALQHQDLLTMELGIASTTALIPAIFGMVFGQHIRQKLSEDLFRRVFFYALLLLGGYIILNTLFSHG